MNRSSHLGQIHDGRAIPERQRAKNLCRPLPLISLRFHNGLTAPRSNTPRTTMLAA
jgi:hypothetical protein